jgi:hypothetical protein
MTYKIISTRQVEETLFTTVEYNLDGEIRTIEVAHFMPDSAQTIDENIINRAQTELTRIQAEQSIKSIVNLIVLNEEKPIE